MAVCLRLSLQGKLDLGIARRAPRHQVVTVGGTVGRETVQSGPTGGITVDLHMVNQSNCENNCIITLLFLNI